jgi:serine/threonine protein kinase
VGTVRQGPDTSLLETAENAITGTPAFIAPEQAVGGVVDGRADLYAVGCVAYWLLTGQFVFTADTPMGLILQHAQAQPVPPSRRTTQAVPPALEALVLCCLAKDPAERPQSARELAARLDAIDGAGKWTQREAQGWWQQHLPARP